MIKKIGIVCFFVLQGLQAMDSEFRTVKVQSSNEQGNLDSEKGLLDIAVIDGETFYPIPLWDEEEDLRRGKRLSGKNVRGIIRSISRKDSHSVSKGKN